MNVDEMSVDAIERQQLCDLLDELGPHAHTERLVHGVGIARGWLSGAEASILSDADRAWRKFAKAKPFWH